jgi:hypothetical protein
MRINSLKTSLPMVAAFALASYASVASNPKPQFLETYTGDGPSGLSIKLQMLKPMPSEPQAGWLNYADVSAADASLGSIVRLPVRIVTKPAFVAFDASNHGGLPAGRFFRKDGDLIVCVLSMTSREVKGTHKIEFVPEYDLCAAVRKAVT